MIAAWREILGPDRAPRILALLDRIQQEADPFRPLVAGRLKALQIWEPRLALAALGDQPAQGVVPALALYECCLLLADPAVHQAARLVKGARNLRQALDQGLRDPVPGLADGLEAEATGLLDALRARIAEMESRTREALELARSHRHAALGPICAFLLANTAILAHARNGQIPDPVEPTWHQTVPAQIEAFRAALFDAGRPEEALVHIRSALVLAGAMGHGTTRMAVRWIASARQARESLRQGKTPLDLAVASILGPWSDLEKALLLVRADPSRLLGSLHDALQARDWAPAAEAARASALACAVLALPLIERASSIGVVREAILEAEGSGDSDTALAMLEGI